VAQKAENKHYDVMICGAGPAGASASKFLSDAGFNVLVIDAKALPRPKLCAGGLNPRAYEFVRRHFGTIPQNIFSRPISWMGLRAQFGAAHDLHEFFEWNRHDEPQGYSPSYPEIPNAVSCIWRDKFDYWLLRNSGARIQHKCELIDFKTIDRGKIAASIADKTQGSISEITCSYLIGADGAVSRTRRIVDPAFDQRVSWFNISEQWVEGSIALDPDWYYMFVGRDFIDVFGSFFAKDDYLIFSHVSRKGTPSAGRLASFLSLLKESYHLQVSRQLRRWGCVVNNMGATGSFHFGAGRAVLVGEAAGFIGFCGEGISGALVSAKLAADAIIENFPDPAAVLEKYKSDSQPLRERIQREHEIGKQLPVDAYQFYTQLPDPQAA
jgi:flavin-dependent dehydrogenase